MHEGDIYPLRVYLLFPLNLTCSLLLQSAIKDCLLSAETYHSMIRFQIRAMPSNVFPHQQRCRQMCTSRHEPLFQIPPLQPVYCHDHGPRVQRSKAQSAQRTHQIVAHVGACVQVDRAISQREGKPAAGGLGRLASMRGNHVVIKCAGMACL